MLPQTPPVISSSVAGATEQVLQQPPGTVTGQGEVGKGASPDGTSGQSCPACRRERGPPDPGHAGGKLSRADAGRCRHGPLTSAQHTQEAAVGQNLRSWGWDPNLRMGSSQGARTEMPAAAQQGGQGCKARVGAGVGAEIPPPSCKPGSQMGSPSLLPRPGAAVGGADMPAPQHMYPSVSPSVGVYRALTQETCDGRIVARLGEGSNRTRVLSAD